MDPFQTLAADVESCRACPRLVEWREQVGEVKRAAFRDEEYWARPVPGFGDPQARVVVVGLAPAAHGANRTGRMFTGDRSGDFLYAASPPHGLRQPADLRAPRRRPGADRRVDHLTGEVRATGQQADAGRAGQLRRASSTGSSSCSPRPGSSCRSASSATSPCAATWVCARAPSSATASRSTGRATAAWIVCSYHVSQQNTFTGTLTEEMFDAVLARAGELATS